MQLWRPESKLDGINSGSSGGRALFAISERLPALTAPCKEELCGCVLWEVNPCVATQGGDFAGGRRE